MAYDAQVWIGELLVDATLSEKHSFTVEVTDFPVERGANIADHRRPKPDQVQIEGVVSNTPIKAAPLPLDSEHAGQRAFDYLKRLRDSAELIDIITNIDLYEDMSLIDAQMPRDVKTGDAFQFTATFKRIRIVENKTALVVTAAPNGKPKEEKGKDGTKEGGDAKGKHAATLKEVTNHFGLTKEGSGVNSSNAGNSGFGALFGGVN